MINLFAEIIPGKSAAGFHLGQRIDYVKSSVTQLTHWDRASGKTLPEVMTSTPGWLEIFESQLNGTGKEKILCFGKGAVELRFSGIGILYEIAVFEGYSGHLWTNIKIGCPLIDVQHFCELTYDDGDEMHYPTENCSIEGISFYAEEQALNYSPNQILQGISIHDWHLRDQQ